MTTRLLVDEAPTWHMGVALGRGAAGGGRPSVGSSGYGLTGGRKSLDTAALLGGTTHLLPGGTAHLLAGVTTNLLPGERIGRYVAVPSCHRCAAATIWRSCHSSPPRPGTFLG